MGIFDKAREALGDQGKDTERGRDADQGREAERGNAAAADLDDDRPGGAEAGPVDHGTGVSPEHLADGVGGESPSEPLPDVEGRPAV